ncbi:hypothetical protein ACG98G_04275 [Megasphaera hexanoica]|uniref:Uncharacterized protein n=1 Tax=Megasphaera hexanoica TaxID=1675036 RepID=A0ABW7DLT8_9FIRM|nr:hypothetical protein [Megasphaera hexanoica]AXB82511.1 hypothetical protein ACT01_09845 [Megasphaera hexanoica]
MVSNIITLFRKTVSSIAIFMAICAVIVCVITIVWWIFPIESEPLMKVVRWILGTIITLALIGTKKIKIN